MLAGRLKNIKIMISFKPYILPILLSVPVRSTVFQPSVIIIRDPLFISRRIFLFNQATTKRLLPVRLVSVIIYFILMSGVKSNQVIYM